MDEKPLHSTAIQQKIWIHIEYEQIIKFLDHSFASDIFQTCIYYCHVNLNELYLFL